MNPQHVEEGLREEPRDGRQVQLAYGDGGVPWYLLLFYLAFLVFFTWYVLEHQLPDYLDQGPVKLERSAAASSEAPAAAQK